VRNPEQRTFPWQDMVEIVEGDVLDIYSLERALQGVNQVIHAAAKVSFWRKEHEQVTKVNAEGTANLVNACLDAEVDKLVHVSSVAAIGKQLSKGESLLNEETPWNPSLAQSKYALSKYRAEMEVYRGISEGLNAAIVNPGFILGPTDNWQEGTGKIFSIIHRGLRFYNRGLNGYVGVGDVARACRLVLEKEVAKGERYILVGENLSYQQVFGMIAGALGKEPPRWGIPPWLSIWVGRISELLAAISGKAPIVSLESMRSGIRQYQFDGRKIKQLGLEYEPIAEVVHQTAQQYLADQAAKS
jgi:dihydroflavonol-4-reductase